MRHILNKVAQLYYASLLGTHIFFLFLPDLYGFRDLHIEILSIYYHLLSAQIGLCLIASLFYILSFKKIMQGKAEFYLFPSIVLLVDCVATFAIMRNDVSIVTWVGLITKIVGCILFVILYWPHRQEMVFDFKKIFLGMGMGFYYYIFCFLYSLIPYLFGSVSKVVIYAFPIVITIISFICIKLLCDADFSKTFIISYLSWFAFSPIFSSPMYDLIKNFLPFAADTYADSNLKYLVIFSNINFLCWLFILGLLWLKGKINKNTGDGSMCC